MKGNACLRYAPSASHNITAAVTLTVLKYETTVCILKCCHLNKLRINGDKKILVLI